MEANKKKGDKVHYFDYSLLAIVIFLMCFGLVMLYSTSSYDIALYDDTNDTIGKAASQSDVSGS